MARSAIVVPLIAAPDPTSNEALRAKGDPLPKLWDFVEAHVWSQPHYKVKTRANYRRTRELSRALPDYPAPDDVARWVSRLRSIFSSEQTVNRHWKDLCTVYKFSNQLGRASGNPAALVHMRRPTPEPRPIVNIDEVWPLLLEACRDERERGFVAVQRFAGLRRGEALGLTVDDINRFREPWRLEVHWQRPDPNKWETGPTKTRAAVRALAMREPLQVLVAEVLALGKPTVRTGYGGGGRRSVPFLFPFHEDQLGDLITRLRHAVPAALPPGRAWHVLRDTFALELYRKGKTVGQIRAALGHTSEKVTIDAYIGWFNRDVPADIFEGLDGPSTPRLVAPPGAVSPAAEKRTAGVGAPAVQRRSTEQFNSREEKTPCSTTTRKQRALPGLSVGPVVRKRKR